MDYVLYAVDGNPDYLGFLPLSIASWQRLGFMSAVGYANTPCRHYATREVACVNGSLPSARVAMPFRFCLPNHLDFDDNDLLIVADVDSVILNFPWLDEVREEAERGKIVSVAHDWSQFNVVAAWYLAATARTFRELIPWTIEQLIEMHADELRGELGGGFDERWLYRDIFKQHEDRFRFIIRERADRISSQQLLGVNDVHVHLWDYRVTDGA